MSLVRSGIRRKQSSKTSFSLWLMFLIIVSAILTSGVAASDFKVVDAELWIQNHGTDPILYLVQKFEHNDIVILGEEHRVREFPRFVAGCIPSLYQQGVTVIALEFENSINQPLIDSFLALPWMDNELLYAIRRRSAGDIFALFKEYNDIFRVCWSFNQSLPDTLSRFRIVALDLADDDSSVTTTGAERAYARDKHMFEVLESEVMLPGRKALVYCGWMHAMTKLTPPKVSEGHVSKTEQRIRLGNYIWNCCSDRAFSVFLYSPHPYTPDSTVTELDLIIPVDGLIEEVLAKMNDKPVGFDIDSSPFASLATEGAFFRFMKEDWKLADICDGYIFLLPVSEWEPVAIENIYTSDSVFHSTVGDRFKKYSLEQFLRMEVDDVQKTVKYLKSQAYENLYKLGE